MWLFGVQEGDGKGRARLPYFWAKGRRVLLLCPNIDCEGTQTISLLLEVLLGRRWICKVWLVLGRGGRCGLAGQGQSSSVLALGTGALVPEDAAGPQAPAHRCQIPTVPLGPDAPPKGSI